MWCNVDFFFFYIVCQRYELISNKCCFTFFIVSIYKTDINYNEAHGLTGVFALLLQQERFHGKRKLHRLHFLDYQQDTPLHLYEKPQRDSVRAFDQAYFWSYSGIGTPSDLWQQAIRVLPGDGKDAKPKPMAMPVTENLKRDPDPVAYYGLPKELMPIHPGGGSRFEDLEKERLERAKLAHTKDDGDDTENGAGHDAEGLYSSAAAPFLSLPAVIVASCVRFIL